MPSHVKLGYAVSQQLPLYFPISDNTAKRKAQAELLFCAVMPSVPTTGSPDYIQPMRADSRVFNFTDLQLTQIHLNGLRTPMDAISITPYTVPRKQHRLRHDVVTLLELCNHAAVKDNVVIVQRFTLHGRDEKDLAFLIESSTLPSPLKDKLRDTGYKKSTIGDKTYHAIDGMFMTFVSKADLKIYMGALEAYSGVFVSREDLAQSQPHPYDRNPILVQGAGFEEDVDKAALCSYRYVYHDAIPQQVYVNLAGSIVAIPPVHDAHAQVGIHFVTSTPQKGALLARVHRQFIEPKDILEKNGFYLSEAAAHAQLRQDQIDRMLDFNTGIVRQLNELGKGLDRSITDLFAKTFTNLGEIMKPRNDLLREILDEPLRDLRKEIDLFRTRNEALSVAALMNKAEHERTMQERKESQEHLKLVPLAITTVMSILAVATKRK